jgi:hypothetical protein
MWKKHLYNMNRNLLFIILVLITINSELFSQEYSDKSMKVGLGFGINEGMKETGMGVLVSFGYQKTLANNRIRINPNYMSGGFFPFAITDTRDQYYRISSLGINCYWDAIKYKPFAIFIGAGGHFNFTRGLIGTGGWPEEGNTSSDYLFKLYFVGSLSTGIRINQPDSRLAYEFVPITICLGNDNFLLEYVKIGIDIKLINKEIK